MEQKLLKTNEVLLLIDQTKKKSLIYLYLTIAFPIMSLLIIFLVKILWFISRVNTQLFK